MSSPSGTPTQPRRSAREKKQSKPITTVTEPSTTGRKRKHVDTDDEGPAGINDNPPEDEDADADEEDVDEDGSQDGDERPKKSRKKAKGQAANTPRTAATSTRKPKKPRVPKDPTTTKSKKRANEAPNAPFDPASLTKTTNISFDNPLFNAILNPNSALQGTVEDFLQSLNEDENQALAELVNMILRCCACNDTVDGDTAVDYDGVPDRLDEMVEDPHKTTGAYPLVSKVSPFHNTKTKFSFRANLSEFISRLVDSAALLGSLYNSELMPTLSVWLVTMSSSQIRSIRHTSTFIALEVEAGLCKVAQEVEKEVELTGRMKEGEKKRARTKGATATSSKGKEKELDNKLRECKGRQTKLEEYIKDFIDLVFIHRYRDLDPIIRTECISSLSTFFETLPSHFATDSNYFRYVGWVLSDVATTVRLAAVKALQVVYEGAGAGRGSTKKKKKGTSDGVVLPALRHFTTRFLPRLLEIARYDVDISVRVAVMNVLGCIDELALLPEDERSQLGTLVFSDEARVRKGVARFVSGVLEEWVDEKMGEIEEPTATAGRGRGRGKAASKRKLAANDVDRDKVEIKGLVRLLVRWGRALDRDRRKGANGEQEEEEEEDGSEGQDGGTGDADMGAGDSDARGIAPALIPPPGKKIEGHMGPAVEALWDEMDVVRDWEGILDMLVLDHSAAAENGAPNGRSRKKSAAKKKGKQTNGDVDGQESGDEEDDDDTASNSTRVDQSWRLTEVEEGVLLEILVTSLERTKKDDDNAWEPITQALIKALPRLFVKYQTDENRIIEVLKLPRLMNLEVYLEMRETNAYVSLWSDVSKQFLTHTSSYVITSATQTIISHLLANTAMSNVNSEQILELEDELANSLRNAVAGPAPPASSPDPSISSRDIEICHLSEDEVLTLTSIILRLRTLAQRRDLASCIEENEGGKHSSVFDIISAISERARLSVGGEGQMLEQALHLLSLHLMWKSRPFLHPRDTPLSQDEAQDRETMINQRDALVEKLVEYAVGTQVQGNGIVESVKRAAFQDLLDTHIMFLSPPTCAEDDSPNLALVMDDEVQWRCAGFVQAEVERYADSLGLDKDRDDAASETEDDESDNEGNGGGDGAEGQSKKAKKTKKPSSKENETEIDSSSQPHLEKGYMFLNLMSVFLRAIHTGVIQVRHGAIILAHYGRLGPSFDACAKAVVDLLKEEGLGNDNGQLITLVITQTMKEAFAVFKKSQSNDESNLVALAKLLSSCFLIRGTQLAILRRLDAQHVVEIHTGLITWIVKQLGTRANPKNNDHKAALSFFRALIPLVTTVQSRDALKIKAHLDQAWVQAKIEPANTKFWDSLRAYEKRLGTAMGKDKPGHKARSGKRKKDGGVSTDGEETEVEKLVDDEHALSDDNAPPEPPRARPPPRPRRAAAMKTPAPEPPGSDTEPDSEIEPPPPKTRPRPKAVYKSKASVSPVKTASVPGPLNGAETPVSTRKRPRADQGVEEDQEITPRPSHKRPRLDGEDDDAELPEQQDVDAEEHAPIANGDDADVPVPSVMPEGREATPAADIQIRRKRIRH